MPFVWIGVFFGAVFRYLFAHLPALVVYIMTFLGISAVTYTGVSILVGQIDALIMSHWAQMPINFIHIAQVANVDKALTAYLSIITFKATYGTVKSFKNQYRVVHGGAP